MEKVTTAPALPSIAGQRAEWAQSPESHGIRESSIKNSRVGGGTTVSCFVFSGDRLEESPPPLDTAHNKTLK